MELYKMIYNIQSNTNKVRILGEDFLKNNRNKGTLIINHKKFSLKDILSTSDIKNNKVRMLLNKSVTNRNYMFKNCQTLSSLSYLEIESYMENYENEYDIIETEKNKIDKQENGSLENQSFSSRNNDSDESSNFSYTKNNSSEISKNNEENKDNTTILNLNNNNSIICLNGLFYNCESLLYLPKLSNWNISNAIDMSHIFYNCKSLKFIGDISEWNTKNVQYMNKIFYNCESLKNL